MSEVVVLTAGAARAVVHPAEGGVASRLRVAGASVLARTPWADAVLPGTEPAPDEASWVQRWRGGWQLCFPNAGQPDPSARPPQAFHGSASQTPWQLRGAGAAHVDLEWREADGLVASRRWTLHADGLSAQTTARNEGAAPRRLSVAEHLILGGDLIHGGDLIVGGDPILGGGPAAPVVAGTAALVIDAGGTVVELDYDGVPSGRRSPWPGDGWDVVDHRTPARVTALERPEPRVIRVVGPELTAEISWTGLEHALLWEEIGQTIDPPWHGLVRALGVEPTSAPHGAGTARDEGAITLEPGAELSWEAHLRVQPSTGNESAERRDDP